MRKRSNPFNKLEDEFKEIKRLEKDFKKKLSEYFHQKKKFFFQKSKKFYRLQIKNQLKVSKKKKPNVLLDMSKGTA